MPYPGSRGAELAKEPVQAEWVQYDGAGSAVNLSVGPDDITWFSGEFIDEEMPSAVVFGNLRVHEDYRGAGIAARLVRSLAYLAVRHHAAIMYGSVESQNGLRVFRRAMGDELIQYTSGYPESRELPATPSAAMQALARMEADQPDIDWREGITIHINLTGLAIANLEPPVEMNEPLM